MFLDHNLPSVNQKFGSKSSFLLSEEHGSWKEQQCDDVLHQPDYLASTSSATNHDQFADIIPPPTPPNINLKEDVKLKKLLHRPKVTKVGYLFFCTMAVANRESHTLYLIL